jgi:hypothetical protein
MAEQRLRQRLLALRVLEVGCRQRHRLHGHARFGRQLEAACRTDAAARARVGHHERAPRAGLRGTQ